MRINPKSSGQNASVRDNIHNNALLPMADFDTS